MLTDSSRHSLRRPAVETLKASHLHPTSGAEYRLPPTPNMVGASLRERQRDRNESTRIMSSIFMIVITPCRLWLKTTAVWYMTLLLDNSRFHRSEVVSLIPRRFISATPKSVNRSQVGVWTTDIPRRGKETRKTPSLIPIDSEDGREQPGGSSRCGENIPSHGEEGDEIVPVEEEDKIERVSEEHKIEALQPARLRVSSSN